MKVIVAGSRDFVHYPTVAKAIELSGFTITELVSGHARGVDRLGEWWAKTRCIKVKEFAVSDEDWKRSRGAGVARNLEMARYADALIAVWDGKSTGTANMIEHARKLKLKVFIHYV
jgi:hypothetical protein